MTLLYRRHRIQVVIYVEFCSTRALNFSGRSTHIRALKSKVEVAKVHIFVQSGI
jgi:hypothetical protein